MFKKTSLSLMLLGTLVLSGCGGAAPTDNTATAPEAPAPVAAQPAALPDVIKIGFVSPLSGSAASYGVDIKSGVEEYFKEHPTIKDKPVQVVYEDGKCNGQDAANAAQKLINVDKVQIIIGGACSGETLAMAPIAEQNKVVILSPMASSPAITTAGDYIFRNYPSDDQVAKTMVDYVLAHHKKVALLTEQTDYAQGYRGAIKKHMLEANGQTPVVDEAYQVDNTDFRTLLAKVKDSGADALINIAQTGVTAGFAVKQAKELGLNIQIYGGDAVPGKPFFDTAKDSAEGVKVVMVNQDDNRPGYTDFKGKVPPAQSSDVVPSLGYDAAHLVANAIEASGDDGTAIKDFFNVMPAFAGIANDVKFDENGDNKVDAAVIVAKGGKFTPVQE